MQTALWMVRRYLAARRAGSGLLPGRARPRKSSTPAILLLIGIGLAAFIQLLWTQLGYSAGIGISGELVSIDLGTTVPGRPVIWSNALQLTLWSSAPWYLSIKGGGPLQAADGAQLPLERLSWALITPDAVAQWTPLRDTPQMVAEDALPTEPDGRSLTLGFRVDARWDDRPGGPYGADLHLTMAGGADLIPSYVWPQPAVAGDRVSITYFSGGDFTQPSFPATLTMRDAAGVQVHSEVVMVTAEQWSVFYWDTAGRTPGTYRYQVTGLDAALLAQGSIELLDQAPQAGQCRVRGSVSAEGVRLSGVQVQLYDAAYRQVATVTSDVAGEFTFVALPVGGYHLEVRHPGYLPWQSERFYLAEATETHNAQVELIPNNALSIQADYRIVRTLSGERSAGNGAQGMQPGDIVAVTAIVRNTGTRSLHAPVVEVSWPEGLTGLCEATVDSSVCVYALPNLAPGESASFQTSGVARWAQAPDPFSFHEPHTHSIQIAAHAWAQNADDTLTLVSAPTRFLTLTSRRPGQTAGYLAVQLYWDRNENGRRDPTEEGIGGVELRLSGGERIKTQSDGWAYTPVADEVVSVWLTAAKHAETIPQFMAADALNQLLQDDVLLYQGVIRPGAAEVVRIGLNGDGMPTQPPGNRLELLWTPGAPASWQALGHLRTGGENWQLTLDMPLRFSAAYFFPLSKGGKQFHQLRAGRNATKPYLIWHGQIQTASTEQVPQNVIDAQLALGTQVPAVWERLPLLGSGPYQLPVRVEAVHQVVGCYLGKQVNLTAQQYDWSPMGTLWLSQSPQEWLPERHASELQQSAVTNVCANELENVLYVLYLPETTAAEASPALAASMRIHTYPDAVAAGNANDQWQLRWLHPWAQDDSTRWRWGFVRQSSGGRFAWELGTFADPGFSLAETWALAPTVPGGAGDMAPDHALAPLRGLPIYLNVEQTWQGDNWLLQANYQSLRSWRVRTIKAAWRFQTPLVGDIGLTLRRFTGDVPAYVGAAGTGLDFTIQLQHGFGRWSWQWQQRFPLWLSTQAGDSGSEKKGRLQPAGVFRVHWQAEERSGINAALQLNTQNMQGALDVGWRGVTESSRQIAAGMRCQVPLGRILAQMLNPAAGETDGALSLSWTPWLQAGWRSAQNPYGLEVQLSYQGGRLPIARFGLRLGSIRTQWEQSAQTRKWRLWYVGAHGSDFLAAQLEYNTEKEQPEATFTGRIIWQGSIPYLGNDTTGSISLQWGAYRGEQAQVTATSGVLAASVRRQFGANAFALGTNWPWYSARSADDAHAIAQQSWCTWVLWERRLLQKTAFSLWGGLELRYSQGTWAPRWQIALK